MHQSLVNSWKKDLKMDIIYPERKSLPGTGNKTAYPCILWICGGAWLSMDRSAHLVYLASLARKGFVVASAEYRTSNEVKYPVPIQDIKSGVFKNKVTIHYSLNAVGRERDFLMPVNYDYNYADFINDCKLLYAVTKEKISVGIILFNKFRTDKDESPFSINKENLSRILDSLDSDMFRIDLCDYNEISTGEQFEMRNEDANKLLKYIRERGFQAKMFSSYGRENSSGCGMLHSDTRKMSKPGNTTLKNLRSAIHILQQAMQIKQDRYTQ